MPFAHVLTTDRRLLHYASEVCPTIAVLVSYRFLKSQYLCSDPPLSKLALLGLNLTVRRLAIT